MFSDLRIAFRQLRKSPGFTVTAIVTLALGIGANAVVFSVLNALVLRPVNVPDAQNLFQVQRSFQRIQVPSQSYLNYLDLRDRNRTFKNLAEYYDHWRSGRGYRRKSFDGVALPGQRQLLRHDRHSAVSGPLLSCFGRQRSQ